MPKITEEELEAIHIRLFKSDLDFLRQVFPGQPIGYATAIRNIIRAYVRQVKGKADDAINQGETVVVSAEELL